MSAGETEKPPIGVVSQLGKGKGADRDLTKVLGIVGSRRRLGNSDVLVREAINRVREEGLETQIVYLDQFRLEECKGCLSCVFKGKCALNDDLEKILSLMLSAQGLIVGAPTYLFSPPGIIKILGDRGLNLSSYLDNLKTQPRYGIAISISGDQRWNPMGVEFLTQFCWIYGFRVIDYLEAYGPGPGEVALDEANLAGARAIAHRLVQALAGNPSKRPAAPNQCPVCYSRNFRINENGCVVCPICLNQGHMVMVNGQPQIEFQKDPPSISDHFWSWDYRIHHLHEWVIPTRDRYLKLRPAIKEKLKKYRIEIINAPRTQHSN